MVPCSKWTGAIQESKSKKVKYFLLLLFILIISLMDLRNPSVNLSRNGIPMYSRSLCGPTLMFGLIKQNTEF